MNGSQLAAAVGVTYRQIDYWTRRGFVRPYVMDPGNGHPRDYPPSEIRIARDLAALVAAGVTVETAHAIARGDTAALRTLAEALRPIVEAA
jgi:DNA-binding transcriptional MerR regulator